MRRPFGKTSHGENIEILDLHAGELTVSILTYGAIVNDVRLKGVPHSLTLGSADLAAYEDGPMAYYGALVGPMANRIAHAQAPLGDNVLHFEANEGTTCLHSGTTGLHTQVFNVETHSDTELVLSADLPDGLGGFPGNRHLRVRYSVDAPAHLRMRIDMTTDKDTLVNIANHSFWNLDDTADISAMTLTIPADHYTPTNDAHIPTGVADVTNTHFDLRQGIRLGDPEARVDHNLCLPLRDGTLQKAATLTAKSGLSLRIDTTEPGIQTYDAGEQDTAPFKGHHGQPYGAFCGIALEPQRWPDGPNQTNFPSCELAAGETYHQETVWSFSRANKG